MKFWEDRFVCMCWRGCWAWAECRLHLMTHLILDNSSPWTQGPQGPQGLHLMTQNSSPSLDTRTNRRSDFVALYNTNPRANVRIKFREIMNIFQKSKVTVHSESFPHSPNPAAQVWAQPVKSLCVQYLLSSLSLWQPLLILTLPYFSPFSPSTSPLPTMCLFMSTFKKSKYLTSSSSWQKSSVISTDMQLTPT